jgi:hypothetical protein
MVFFFFPPNFVTEKLANFFQKISKSSQIYTLETHYQNFTNFLSTKFVSKEITGTNYKPRGTMKEGRLEGRTEGRMHVQLQGRSSVSPSKLFRFFAHIFSTQRGKMGGEKFKQKRTCILCFLCFKLVS